MQMVEVILSKTIPAASDRCPGASEVVEKGFRRNPPGLGSGLPIISPQCRLVEGN